MTGLIGTREPSHRCPCKSCRSFRIPTYQEPCAGCSVLGWTKYIPSNRVPKMKLMPVKTHFTFD
jgi:hypothetical protein